jgi:hypothetical protein
MKNTPAKEKPGNRKEFIKVAPNVRLHVTDLGEGKPRVLICGHAVAHHRKRPAALTRTKNGA